MLPPQGIKKSLVADATQTQHVFCSVSPPKLYARSLLIRFPREHELLESAFDADLPACLELRV
jgi:hypothetical protein